MVLVHKYSKLRIIKSYRRGFCPKILKIEDFCKLKSLRILSCRMWIFQIHNETLRGLLDLFTKCNLKKSYSGPTNLKLTFDGLQFFWYYIWDQLEGIHFVIKSFLSHKSWKTFHLAYFDCIPCGYYMHHPLLLIIYTHIHFSQLFSFMVHTNCDWLEN